MPSALPSPTITLISSPDILIPQNGNKDTISRLTAYATWLTDRDNDYLDVDLATYRDHLFDRGLAPTTIQAHLSTARMRYQELLRDETAKYPRINLGSTSGVGDKRLRISFMRKTDSARVFTGVHE